MRVVRVRVLLDEDIDVRLRHEFSLRVVVLRARSKRLPDLAALVPELERRMTDLRPGDAVRIHPPS
jgi:BMFP domain-containing protein YqiC